MYDVSSNDTSPNLFAAYLEHIEPVTAVGFEPHYTAFVYSASEDGTLRTWVPELAGPAQQQQQQQQQAYGAAFQHAQPQHPMVRGNGNRFPAVPAKIVNDGPNGVVPIHDAIYYHPLDLFFTVDYNGRLRTWEHATQKMRSQVIPHPSRRNLQCVELSADCHTLVTANFDGLVFVYDVDKLLKHPDQVKPHVFRTHTSYVPRVRLSVSGSLLVCTTCSGNVRLYRMADVMASHNSIESIRDGAETTVSAVREFVNHPGSTWDAVFVDDREDYLFTCSSNTKVMLWNLSSIQQSIECSGHEKAVVCLAVRERFDPSNGEQHHAERHEQLQDLRDDDAEQHGLPQPLPSTQTYTQMQESPEALITSPVTEAGTTHNMGSNHVVP